MRIVERSLSLEADGVGGHISYPEREEPGPAVLLLHSVTGRIGYLKLEARKLAKLGYATFVPSLYPLLGAPAVPNIELGAKIQAQTSDADFNAAIDRCWDFLVRQEYVDPARIAVGGYCMGSRLAILYIAQKPAVRAFIGYYPTVHDEARTELRQTMPWEAAREMRCPSIVIYGARDTVTTVPIQLRMLSAFIESGQPVDWHFLAVGGHGFVDPDSSNYQPYPAEIAWPLVVDFLDRELSGSKARSASEMAVRIGSA
jgi:dienelactone hydrolase